MTDTLAERPPEAVPYKPYEAKALVFLATGMTAEGLRAHAANARYVECTARLARVPAQAAYAELLLIADAIGAWEDKGLTRQDAYARAGMDEEFGPYPGPDSLHVA